MIHLDNLGSDEFAVTEESGKEIQFHQLLTAVVEDIVNMVDISEGIDVDREDLENRRFADDVALLNKTNGKIFKHSKLRKSGNWL